MTIDLDDRLALASVIDRCERAGIPWLLTYLPQLATATFRYELRLHDGPARGIYRGSNRDARRHPGTDRARRAPGRVGDVTLLEAREAGTTAAEQEDGGPWTFSRVYLRDGEWIAVLQRAPNGHEILHAARRTAAGLKDHLAAAIAAYNETGRDVKIIRRVVVGRP